MINLKTPNGLAAHVPATVSEDLSPHFHLGQIGQIREYFAANGCVVVSTVIPKADTQTVRRMWDREVKPFRGKIYRQATAKLERHRFNERGWVLNPILNVQSLDPRRFGGLRDHVRRNVLASPDLRTVLTGLLSDRPKIVQSMYFEGNSATWEHHDSYYLDSEHIGSMIGAWIALEDIAPCAGRFFVVPGSHKTDWQNQTAAKQVATAHEKYVESVVESMRANSAEVRAPALREGDVLFWHALTIHGSLASHDPQCSRSSITCHTIPAAHRLMQYHARIKDIATEDVHGVLIHAPKGMALLRNRLIRTIENCVPGLFYALKNATIKTLVR